MPRILHPTDFSTSADEARMEATRLARALDAEVVMLHVLDDTTPLPEVPADLLERLERARRDEAEARLAERLAELRDAGVRASTRLESGHPVDVIVRIADEGRFDYVVMGTRGRGPLGRLLAGSVATGVVREAPCTVVTVRQARAVRRAGAA